MMYFWSRAAFFENFGGVRSYWSFRGTWRNCIASSCSFRCGYGDTFAFPESVVFSANMTDCEAGPLSFLGDGYPSENYTSENCRLERCRCLGVHYELNYDPLSTVSGFAGFAGCTAAGVAIGATVEFIDCTSGPHSFGSGNNAAGTFIRCRGGDRSFGATLNDKNFGMFSGYAEVCFGGPDSFGGRTSLSDASNSKARNRGTMVRCQSLGHTRPINLEGAVIRDSRITTTTEHHHGVVLLDDESKITNSDLVVVQGGSGVPIYAGTARNVVAAHLRMNNASTTPSGLHENVTNLIATPANVVADGLL